MWDYWFGKGGCLCYNGPASTATPPARYAPGWENWDPQAVPEDSLVKLMLRLFASKPKESDQSIADRLSLLKPHEVGMCRRLDEASLIQAVYRRTEVPEALPDPKTLFHFQDPVEPFYFEVSGDYRHLDGVQTGKGWWDMPELVDELKGLMFDSRGNYRFTRLEAPTRDWAYYVRVGPETNKVVPL